MKDDNEYLDISDEFTRSLERLVEEETNVARAYVKSDAARPKTASKSGGVDLGNTQFFDAEKLKKTISEQNSDFDFEVDELFMDDDVREYDAKKSVARSDMESRKNQSSGKKTVSDSKDKSAEQRRNRMIIAGVVCIVAVAVAGIIIAAVMMNKKNKNSYEYNMSQGDTFYESADYSNAISSYKEAYMTSEGKKNTDLMYRLYECYYKREDTVLAASMLNDMISFDKYNEKAIVALGNLYRETKNGAGINELLEKYRSTNGEQYIKSFEVLPPTASETPGNFSDTVKLTLMAADDCSIYYTIDGSEPTITSNIFKDEIVIKSEKVTVKAIAIDSIGVKSSVAAFEYSVNYELPDGPVFNIESGTIDTDTELKITNMKPDDKAYYTLDGTTPTESSVPYVGAIKLEKGNFVISAVIVGANGETSKIVRNTYVVKEVRVYQYEEAVGLLKSRMISLNILQSNGMYTTDGNKASFYFDSKKVIDAVEMHIIRYSVTLPSGESTQGYYGVGTKNGSCYKVTVNGDQYTAVKY